MRRARKKRGGKRRHGAFFFTSTTLVAGFGIAVIASAAYFAVLIRDLPSPDEFSARGVNQSTKIYDRTGKTLLYELHGEEKRTVVPFDEVPASLKQATLAAEDAGFYTQPAFDWRGIVRALITNIRERRISQGGSTITQQLARSIFLSTERTYTRKIKELVLAIELESKYRKDEIFGFYLNQIPFGSNAYGAEAASRTYLGKSVRELTLAESAVLAALIKAPTFYSPWGNNLKELLARKDYILDRMVSLGSISVSDAEKAKEQEINFLPPSIGSIKAPHFTLAVKDYLINRYGESLVLNGGLRVITTIDMNLQELAESAVLEGTERNTDLYGSHNAAIVVQDPKTGQVLALSGSKNYFGSSEPEGCATGKTCAFEGNFNVATQGLRQPGSALKPFVYLTAFQKGYSPKTVVFDVSTEFDLRGNPETSYRPVNFDGRYRGPVSFENALAQSLNIPAVKVLYLAGFDDVLKNLHRAGITTLQERWRYGLSLTLGGGEVMLVDLANAYATLSQDGTRHNQSMVLSVQGAEGNILEEYRDHAERVFDAQEVRLVTQILSTPELRAPIFGQSNALTVFPDHEIALKTGTSEDHRDAWTIGYTPNLVVGVWAGNNDNSAMIRQGSSILAAVPIWNAFLKEALPRYPSETFVRPEPFALPVKPMMNGQSEFVPVIHGVAYPQLHSILYYVRRADPQGPIPNDPVVADAQFQNWEEGVREWASARVPNFASYNQLPPEPIDFSVFFAPTAATGTFLLPPSTPSVSGPITITNLKPESGSFVSPPFTIEASITANAGIARIELYHNRRLINAFDLNETRHFYTYRHEGSIDSQNLFELSVTDRSGRSAASQIILYR